MRLQFLGAVIFAGAWTGMAWADTITYDFNNNTLDGLSVGSTPGYSYSVSGGALNAGVAAGAGNGDIAFWTPFNVSGDFTATIDATRTSVSSGGLMVLETLVPGGFVDLYTYGQNSLGSSFNNGVNTSGSGGSSATTLTLQLARAGNTITASFSTDGGGTYSVVQTRTDPTFGAGSSPLYFTFQDSAGDLAAQSVSFDDFTVSSDSVHAVVPLPSAGISAMALLAAVTGWRWMRRTRTA